MSPQGAVCCFNLSTYRAAFNSFQQHPSAELNRVTSDTQHLLMYSKGLHAASSSANPFTKLSIPKTNTINKLAMEAFRLPAVTCCKLGIRWLFFTYTGQKVTLSRPDASSAPRPGDFWKEACHSWCFEPAARD